MHTNNKLKNQLLRGFGLMIKSHWNHTIHWRFKRFKQCDQSKGKNKQIEGEKNSYHSTNVTKFSRTSSRMRRTGTGGLIDGARERDITTDADVNGTRSAYINPCSGACVSLFRSGVFTLWQRCERDLADICLNFYRLRDAHPQHVGAVQLGLIGHPLCSLSYADRYTITIARIFMSFASAALVKAV